MELVFAGAAREVTGSCHLVRVNGRVVALDCGMFQGRRSEAGARNRRLPASVDEIDAVVLSHAHIDHSGRLPFLVRHGFAGTIWSTAATRDLCAYMLMDSAHIQVRDAEFLTRRRKEHLDPLYDTSDVATTMTRMVGVPYHRTFDVLPGVRATFVDAGHILGSASVILDCEERGERRRLVFSGDVGRRGLAIVRDPQPPADADVVIMESTYGDRDHPPMDDARARLGAIVRDTAARGGRIMVPAFAVGRTQELLYDLHELARAGEIPRIPVFIDSPLAIDVTAVFEAHPDSYDSNEDLVRRVNRLFRFDLVRYTRETEESKALNEMRGPMVIVAASGMAESGRILHHLLHGAPDPRNTILIVGFQAEHTLGRRLVERQPTIRVFGDEVARRARVEVLNGYSAHADRTELTQWIEAVRAQSPRLQNVHLVHGEYTVQMSLADRLRDRGFTVTVPANGEKAAF